MKSHRPFWRWIVIVTLTATIVALLAITILALRIGRSLQTAIQAGDNFAQIISSPQIDDKNFAIARSFLEQAIAAMQSADRDMTWLGPALQRLAWLPEIGPTLAAAPTLLHTSSQLAEIGGKWVELAEPALKTSVGAGPLNRMAAMLAGLGDHLPVIDHAVSAVSNDLATIQSEDLLVAAADPVSQLQSSVALLHAGLQLSDQLPILFGNNKTASYLVLVQNNYELRATGGFITAVGLLKIRHGEILDFTVEDSYNAPSGDEAFLPAPLPMQRYMQIKSLVLRDVNWSPDLPTTARLAATLYRQNSNQAVDGVITIDLQAVELLVEALQPLALPDSDEPITAANLIERLKAMWGAPPQAAQSDQTLRETWWAERKNFIPLVAGAIFARLQSGNFEPLAVASALERAINQRALQFWSAVPVIQNELSELGWDGALTLPTGEDFVALVDSNMGYNKVDALLERSLVYQVQWDGAEPNRGLATIMLTYRHPLTLTNPICEARPYYGDTYDDMMARCYFDFFRLYTPAGSELVGIDGIEADSLLQQNGEGGSTLFGGYLVVQPGEEKRVILQYRLPVTIQPENYRLTIRKQAGVAELPLNVTIGSKSWAKNLIDGLLQWSIGQENGE